MAANERGRERGNDKAGHGQKTGTARRNLPRVDFEAMNFEERRPPYNGSGREGDAARNQGEPQQGDGRRIG